MHIVTYPLNNVLSEVNILLYYNNPGEVGVCSQNLVVESLVLLL